MKTKKLLAILASIIIPHIIFSLIVFCFWLGNKENTEITLQLIAKDACLKYLLLTLIIVLGLKMSIHVSQIIEDKLHIQIIK